MHRLLLCRRAGCREQNGMTEKRRKDEQERRIARLHDTAAQGPCGTRAKYIGAHCRCMLCRAANSRYQTERERLKKEGKGNPLVSAASARRHILSLSGLGVGRRAIADACDLRADTIHRIRTRAKKHIRKSTERAILSVTKDAVADRALIPASPTWWRIRVLLHEGFSRRELARRLGSKAKVPALQLRTTRITARNANKVEKLYRIVMAGVGGDGPGRKRRKVS